MGIASIKYENFDLTYISYSCLLIRGESVIRVSSLSAYHQFEFWELFIGEDLLFVDTSSVFLALLVKTLTVEALIAASLANIVGVSPRVLREVIYGSCRLKHVIGG